MVSIMTGELAAIGGWAPLLKRIMLVESRISNLIGQGLPCHGSRCRFEADLIRILLLVKIKA